jgi:hypothetical protein
MRFCSGYVCRYIIIKLIKDIDLILNLILILPLDVLFIRVSVIVII